MFSSRNGYYYKTNEQSVRVGRNDSRVLRSAVQSGKTEYYGTRLLLFFFFFFTSTR